MHGNFSWNNFIHPVSSSDNSLVLTCAMLFVNLKIKNKILKFLFHLICDYLRQECSHKSDEIPFILLMLALLVRF
jgi:hypothetical protein